MKTLAVLFILAAAMLSTRSAIAQDVHEPDNSYSSAVWIPNPTDWDNRSIDPVGDVDYRKFEAGPGGATAFQASASGDTQIYLIRGRDNQLLTWGQVDYPGDIANIQIDWLEGGTHYLVILDRGNDDVIPSYRLTARWTDLPAVADAYEPDNTITAARIVLRGHPQNRSIHAAGNVDWARFTVPSPGVRNLEVVSSGDVQMWLIRGRDRQQMGYAEHVPGSGDAAITLAWLDPGTYFVKIQDWGNNGIQWAYQFAVGWTTATIAPDSCEPDNVSTAAKTISNGQAQRRTIHAAGNRDWAKFRVGAAGARNVRLETSGASGDTQMWLYRANAAGTGAGTQIGYNNNGGFGAFSRIDVAALQRGTYYVRVQESGNNGLIPGYTLRASWLTP